MKQDQQERNFHSVKIKENFILMMYNLLILTKLESTTSQRDAHNIQN